MSTDDNRDRWRGLRLSVYWQEVHRPRYQGDCSVRTIREYRATLRYWREVTRNPLLAEITDEDLYRFREVLRGALSPATVNKHLRHVAAVLNRAGPRWPGSKRSTLRILDDVPGCESLRTERHLPRDVDDATLAAIVAACRFAVYPRIAGVQPRRWWEALLLAALTTGYRHAGLLSLRWDGIDWQRATVRLEACGDKCRRERIKPLRAELLIRLQAIQNGSPLIFAWPHSSVTWYRQWHAIQEAAGLPRSAHITFHDLKRACLTRVARVGGSAWAVQLMGDHSSIRTSEAYVNATSEARAMVERLPLPPGFAD
jgi:integrase